MKPSERFAWFSLGAGTVLVSMVLAVAEAATLPQTAQIIVTVVLAAAVVALNAARVRLNAQLKQIHTQLRVLAEYARQDDYARMAANLATWLAGPSHKLLQGPKPRKELNEGKQS